MTEPRWLFRFRKKVSGAVNRLGLYIDRATGYAGAKQLPSTLSQEAVWKYVGRPGATTEPELPFPQGNAPDGPPITRLCPFTRKSCNKTLPKPVISMKVLPDIAVCSEQCALNYAKGLGQDLVGESGISGPEGTQIMYRIGKSIHNPEKGVD